MCEEHRDHPSPPSEPKNGSGSRPGWIRTQQDYGSAGPGLENVTEDLVLLDRMGHRKLELLIVWTLQQQNLLEPDLILDQI